MVQPAPDAAVPILPREAAAGQAWTALLVDLFGVSLDWGGEDQGRGKKEDVMMEVHSLLQAWYLLCGGFVFGLGWTLAHWGIGKLLR